MKTSTLLLALVAFAALLHVSSADPYNTTCGQFCTTAGTNAIYVNCTTQCVGCFNTVPSGCIPYFNPIFDGTNLQSTQCGFSCQASPSWWQWMLAGFAIFFACAMVGACIMYGTKGAE